MENLIKIGEFEASGSLIVSDPCYDRGTWCSGKIQVKPGKYSAFIKKVDVVDWGSRVHALYIVHENFNLKDLTFKKTDIDVGVDSGQAGFFNDELYDLGLDSEKDDEPSKFYESCCSMTLGDLQAGVAVFGVVSSTGLEDGSYDCYVSDGEEVVASYIDFIAEKDDEEKV